MPLISHPLTLRGFAGLSDCIWARLQLSNAHHLRWAASMHINGSRKGAKQRVYM